MGTRLGRRVVHFANLPIKLLLPNLPTTTTTATSTSTARIREFALKTIPSATKFEIKSVLESLYGFDVDEVRTLNMEGKKKKRGGILLAKPDYKKAYVTLKAPLALPGSLFPIPQIREERERTRQQQRRTERKSVVEEGEGGGRRRRHWMEKDEEEEEEEDVGVVEVGRDRWDRERRGRVVKASPAHAHDRRRERGGGGGGDGGKKFPWSSMRGAHLR